MVVYMNDLLTFSWTVQEHVQHLEHMLQLLRETPCDYEAPKLSV